MRRCSAISRASSSPRGACGWCAAGRRRCRRWRCCSRRAGCAALMWGSAELSAAHLRGDLLVGARRAALHRLSDPRRTHARRRSSRCPCCSSPACSPRPSCCPPRWPSGETVVPADWTGLFALALCSQVAGQGLLVYALGHVPPLVVGIAMLTQPALSALLGWLYYGEAFTPLDWAGAAAIVACAGAGALARAPRAQATT